MFDPLADSENETVIAELTRRSGVKGIDNMLDGFTDIVTSIAKLPRCVNHNDFHSLNVFFRYEKQGPVTYAIDWASIGLGPVGYDCGTLAASGIIRSENEARLIAEIEGHMFTEYLARLSEAGYRHERDVVRLGYLSSIAVFITGYAVAVTMTPEAPAVKRYSGWFGVEGDEFFDELALRLRTFKPLFDEAVSLTRKLG